MSKRLDVITSWGSEMSLCCMLSTLSILGNVKLATFSTFLRETQLILVLLLAHFYFAPYDCWLCYRGNDSRIEANEY